tara:strand:+ start:2099 stop:2545 length:447 start_codon:yes stop_codon:yes gene_type:complete
LKKRNGSVTVQPLNDANSTLLENIAPDVFDNAIDPVQLQAFLDDPRHIMFLAVEEQSVVGMASAVEYFHPDKPPQLWINEVGVTAAHRRRGIGRSLVAALLDVARQRGCVYAWLGTDSDNVAGQACFDSVPGGEQPQPFLLYEWDVSN